MERKCPSCDEVNPSHRDDCMVCGEPLPGASRGDFDDGDPFEWGKWVAIGTVVFVALLAFVARDEISKKVSNAEVEHRDLECVRKNRTFEKRELRERGYERDPMSDPVGSDKVCFVKPE